MRRVVFSEYGGPEVLRVEDASRPEPGEGELVIEVAAIGLSLPVVRSTHGGAQLPHVPGGEVVGRVVSIGSGVTGWRVGQRAAGLAFSGAYAEFAPVAASFLAPVPDDVDDASAVALVRSGQVALGVLRAAALQPGESVLITGAAGGVGHLAVQLASVLGARRVVAAVGSAAKVSFLRDIGAGEVVTYDQPVGEPVDVVLDGVGGAVQEAGLECLAPLGRFVSYNAAGVDVDVNQLRFQAKTVIGFAMAHFASRRPDVYARHREELWKLCAGGQVRPAIHCTLPLERAAEGHRIIESRENLGKVVLNPTS